MRIEMRFDDPSQRGVDQSEGRKGLQILLGAPRTGAALPGGTPGGDIERRRDVDGPVSRQP